MGHSLSTPFCDFYLRHIIYSITHELRLNPMESVGEFITLPRMGGESV